ncbi:hypothetical protein [Paenibacillus hubeiensis]|uniref:hypothetical protein n=1 Tax=Paenibacillus hubeiensis TaxID=3077330 RepID=UPI0031BB13B6
MINIDIPITFMDNTYIRMVTQCWVCGFISSDLDDGNNAEHKKDGDPPGSTGEAKLPYSIAFFQSHSGIRGEAVIYWQYYTSYKTSCLFANQE